VKEIEVRQSFVASGSGDLGYIIEVTASDSPVENGSEYVCPNAETMLKKVKEIFDLPSAGPNTEMILNKIEDAAYLLTDPGPGVGLYTKAKEVAFDILLDIINKWGETINREDKKKIFR